MTTLTFHGDHALQGQALKTYMLDAHDRHIAEDELIAGVYGRLTPTGFKGCHIGCLAYDLGWRGDGFEQPGYIEAQAGLPVWLTRLAEHFFEHDTFSPDEARALSRDILAAIPVGADITVVRHRFLRWVLTDPEHGSHQHRDDAGKAATDKIVALLDREIAGQEVPVEEWNAADGDIGGAAYAARAARAAYDAAFGAADAAYHAAYDAADAADAATTRAQLATLLRLLREAGEEQAPIADVASPFTASEMIEEVRANPYGQAATPPRPTQPERMDA